MGRKKYTTEKFIELSKKSHGDKYDYSKVEYIDMHTKVKILCPEHGLFEIEPYSHSNKKVGCKHCGFVKAGKSRSIGFDEFARRSNKIHHNKYKYHKSTYKGTAYKTTITCPTHGNFTQNSMSHMLGFGCRQCTYSGK